MPSSYPAAYDILANPGPDSQMNDPVNLHSTLHAGANDAIEAIQQTLGLNPQGSSATVSARIGAIPPYGQLLGQTSLDNVSSTSFSWSAMTWTNLLSISSITIPPGITQVRCVLHGGYYIAPGSYGYVIGFGRASGSNHAVNRIVNQGQTEYLPHYESVVTGLTPGSSYPFYAVVRARHSSYTTTWYYGGSQWDTVGTAQTNADYGPIAFEVYAA